jgi:ABC-type sugar transport system permease subunit
VSQTASAFRRARSRPQFWFGLAVLGPLAAWYLVFHWLPILGALFIALHRFDLADPLASRFVGLENFADVFGDKLVPIAFRNSIVYAFIYVVGMLPLSLAVAALLNAVVRGRQGYLFCIFLPVVMNLVAVSVLWLWLYDFAIGPINLGIATLGLPRQKFLNDYDLVLPSVAAVMIWKSLGFNTVILLAGMLNVPTTLYDAAEVDGAGPLRRFVSVTLPLLGHTLMLVSILSIMNGLQIFVPIEVMTGGGPGRASVVVNLMIYQQGIQNVRFGFASALALVLAAIVLCVTVVQLRLLRPRWSY